MFAVEAIDNTISVIKWWDILTKIKEKKNGVSMLL